MFTGAAAQSQSRAGFKVRGAQRKSYDVDTRDRAGVRKHTGLAGERINLATDAAWSYLSCYKSFSRNKRELSLKQRCKFWMFLLHS